MDGKKIMLLGAAGAVGYGIYKAATGAGKLQFGDVKKQKMTFHLLPPKVDIYLILPFTNPTDINYPFRNITGSLMYGETVLSAIKYNGDTSKAFVLNAQKSGFIPILCEVDLLKVGADVVTMIKNGTWLNEARLKGQVISDLNFGFNEKIF